MDFWRRREAGLAILAGWPLLATAATPLRFATDVNDQSGLAPAGRAVLGRACERLGLTVRFEALPLRRSLRMTEQGHLDGEALRIATVTHDHPSLLAVPVPLVTVRVVGYVRATGPVPQDWSLLETLRVGYPRGVVLLEKLGARLPHKVEATNHADLMRLLRAQTIDIALLTLAAGQPEPDAALLADAVALPAPLSVTPLHALLHQRHRELLPRLAGVLQDMENSGEAARLRQAAWSAWAASHSP